MGVLCSRAIFVNVSKALRCDCFVGKGVTYGPRYGYILLYMRVSVKARSGEKPDPLIPWGVRPEVPMRHAA